MSQPGASSRSTPTCSSRGAPLLIDGHNETDGAFIIDGTPGAGIYSLGAGNDVVYGGRGAEQIDPGTGTDLIVGGDDATISSDFARAPSTAATT